MINRIEGILESLEETAALVVVGEIAYEIAVPAADIPELYSRIGSRMTFHTLHYLESQGQGSSFWPKLIGFQSSKDRAFFELITTVKGIGVRRALRALTIPFARVAEAIVMKDLALLMSLPEIGRKTAETMVWNFATRWIRMRRLHRQAPLPNLQHAKVNQSQSWRVRPMRRAH